MLLTDAVIYGRFLSMKVAWNKPTQQGEREREWEREREKEERVNKRTRRRFPIGREVRNGQCVCRTSRGKSASLLRWSGNWRDSHPFIICSLSSLLFSSLLFSSLLFFICFLSSLATWGRDPLWSTSPVPCLFCLFVCCFFLSSCACVINQTKNIYILTNSSQQILN